MTNVCPQCATQNAPGAKFCKKCGTTLAAAAPAAEAAFNPEATAPLTVTPAPAFKFDFDVPRRRFRPPIGYAGVSSG